MSVNNEDRVTPGPRRAANYDAPYQRPWREIPPDLDAITAWTANQQRARAAYNEHMADLEPTGHVAANRRYRARKAER